MQPREPFPSVSVYLKLLTLPCAVRMNPAPIKSVAVIGAGVSGVAAAIHLKSRGLHVTVFERSAKAGGIW